MKRALVCGAGGFIGGHLTRRLKAEGYWVRGVDIQISSWAKHATDEFVFSDLRYGEGCLSAVSGYAFDEIYQLAADFGGMGYIDSHAVECLTNNVAINMNMLKACETLIPDRYFFSSSVCVYRDMQIGEPQISEEAAYPAMPDNEYGWEKLYSERMTLAHGDLFDVRIARFNNCYGPNCVWTGGREKAPAALCRKVAQAFDGGSIEVWGNGRAVRDYIYIDDLINAIRVLMLSNETRPTNIGTDEYVSVNELAHTVIDVSGKNLDIRNVPGIVGVQSRNFSNARIAALGWTPKYKLAQGIDALYRWVAKQ